MSDDITDFELNSLIGVIHKKYNIDFSSYETSSLKRRVSRIIKVFKLDGIYGLWAKVLRDNGFIHLFIEELTVGLTSMFRDPFFWKFLYNDIKKLEGNRFKVWHAGCSSGEEVFSFQILLKMLQKQQKFETYATDLNVRSVKQAQAGEYRIQHLEEYQRNFKEFNPIHDFKKYVNFQNGDKFFQMDNALVSDVKFKQHNLLQDELITKCDFIFCRNVMIYFDEPMKIRLIESFYEMLNPGGKLIIGFYDSIMPILNRDLFEDYSKENKVFIKKGRSD